MKRPIQCIWLACLLTAWLPLVSQTVDPAYLDGKVYLKLNGPLPETAWEQVVSTYQVHSWAQPFRSPGMENVYSFHFRETQQVDALMAEMGHWAEVDYIEKVPLYRTTYIPNDLNSQQWGPSKIQAEEAWDLVRGNDSILIAVIDDAVRTDHEDLIDQIWTNPGEIPGDSIDNDGNGFVDDVHGFDVADDDPDANPAPGNFFSFSHGSHVAGIAGATTDNGVGKATVVYDCSLIPIKVKRDATVGNQLDATAEGMDYAITIGADVVNMSFAGSGFSQTVQSLITVGHFQGVIWVAGAGNDGQWQGRFPASYQHVISVGSTEQNDVKSGFSTYHPTVDVMAPGGAIWSVFSGNTDAYTIMSGTSMACPMVSSLCGLMLAVNPDLEPDEVEACLESGCEDISALNPDLNGVIGAGRINAFRSVLCVPRRQAPLADFIFDRDTVCMGDPVQFTDLSQEFPQQWTWDFGDGTVDTSIHHVSHVYTSPGTYSISLTVSNNMGADSLTFVDAITVLPSPDVMVTVDLNTIGGPVMQASGCNSYSWSPPGQLSCTDCANPQVIMGLGMPEPYYVVTCTNASGCTDTDTVFAAALTSVEPIQIGDLQVLPLHPNPSSGQVELQADFARPGKLEIHLVDLQGRHLETLYQGNSGKEFREGIILSPRLSAGIYLVEWHFEGKRWVQRLAYQP